MSTTITTDIILPSAGNDTVTVNGELMANGFVAPVVTTAATTYTAKPTDGTIIASSLSASQNVILPIVGLQPGKTFIVKVGLVSAVPVIVTAAGTPAVNIDSGPDADSINLWNCTIVDGNGLVTTIASSATFLWTGTQYVIISST